MKLLRTTALTAALITAAVPILTSSAEAWRGWRGGGWRGAAVGAAVVGGALAARSYYGAVTATVTRLMAMGPVTVTRLTAMATGPATATRPTAMATGPALSGADSMPPLGVIGKPD